MSRPNRQVKLPKWAPISEPHHVELPRWEALPQPEFTQRIPVKPNCTAPPAFTVRGKPGHTMIDLLDMLEDTEFEEMLTRVNGTRVGIRLEEETWFWLLESQAEATHTATQSSDFWDFTEPSEFESY